MLTQTLTENHKVNLSSQYQVIAGVDGARVPRLLLTDPQGRLALQGAQLPAYNSYSVVYFAGTNNVQTIIYKVNGTLPSDPPVEVARWVFTYVGGGAADDDDVATGELVIA